MHPQNIDFARNLRQLCSCERSVSQICRNIGINRQQFARYLGGAAEPSAHNLQRICAYFEVTEDELHLPHGAFVERKTRRPRPSTADAILAAFPGDARALRSMMGLFHAHYRSPSEPGRLIRALVTIQEKEGQFLSRTLERTVHPETGQISRAGFIGLVSMHDGTLFLVERGRLSRGTISETVLAPAHRGARGWFVGHLLGFSWRDRKPYSSPCVWKRLRPNVTLRDAVAACGSFLPSSREIEPIVTETLWNGETAGL